MRPTSVILVFSLNSAVHFTIIQCQITDPPTLTAIPGFNDQRECAQNCLIGRNCQGNLCDGVEDYFGCKTNKCLCRPDGIVLGMEWVSNCAVSSCKDTNAGNSIKTAFSQYCDDKGFTPATTTFPPCPLTPVITLTLDPITVTLVGGHTTLVSPGVTTITLLTNATATGKILNTPWHLVCSCMEFEIHY